ncbi:Sterol regulatory element-binding protein 1 [Madurella mycetomatis]|uniref:Sterol regulatory element-binding protein 1 n=1 Tax=Madurella mycetomatis TaxID=100816 RepID=A0A175VR71_9PEZI|nr:Sterol regulatory element-binding protein 1 [Madurella mycetomatis]
MDATPLESVDYWIDFDKDENLSSIPEGFEAPRPNADRKGKAVATRQHTDPGPSSATVKGEEFVDDSALDNALSDNDEGFSSLNLADHLSKIDSAPPQEVPPREGLYSTPLSWERPQPGLRMDSLIGLHSPALNEAEQRRLIAIAMNPGPSMGGLGSNININFGGLNPGVTATFGANFGGGSSGQGPKPVSPPQPSGQHRPAPPNAPKKQGGLSEKGKEKPKSGDRTAHNDIERKYRTNLKDKISELRDAVPSLRTIPEDGGEDDATQPSRAPKVSKGTVLTKATEYIHWLERRNKQIAQEHRELSRRLQAFEQLLHATARTQYTMPTYSRTLFDPRGFC